MPLEGGSMQATLVTETIGEDSVFCSISTYSGEMLHKQTPNFSQKSSVLTVPFPGGNVYKICARFITQKQEPKKGQAVRMLLYSTRQMQVTGPGAS